MIRTTELNSTFFWLFAVTIMSALLTGSTLQWVVKKGLFHHFDDYNVIVVIASVASLIQTFTCFINTIMAPNHVFGFSAYIVTNWVFMTHGSVMLVSRMLSLTFENSEEAWQRLLLINKFMFPLSLFICFSWTTSHNMDSDASHKINAIMEPIQIALWGFIEFCLSAAFIFRMWQFQWTTVERHGIYVMFLVAICDIMSVLLNLFIGDLESTCVKGFVYSLRIRLEVNVLCTMVDYIKAQMKEKRDDSNVEEP